MKAVTFLVTITLLSLAGCASSGPNSNSIRTGPTSGFGIVDNGGGQPGATKGPNE
jgi:hypothetical protein